MRAFHLDRTREQNVVFEMDVLVQISLKIRQRFVQRLIANARIHWRCVSLGGLPQASSLLYETSLIPTGARPNPISLFCSSAVRRDLRAGPSMHAQGGKRLPRSLHYAVGDDYSGVVHPAAYRSFS